MCGFWLAIFSYCCLFLYYTYLLIKEDLQTYKRSIVRFCNIDASGSRIKIATPNPQILLRRILG